MLGEIVQIHPIAANCCVAMTCFYVFAGIYHLTYNVCCGIKVFELPKVNSVAHELDLILDNIMCCQNDSKLRTRVIIHSLKSMTIKRYIYLGLCLSSLDQNLISAYLLGFFPFALRNKTRKSLPINIAKSNAAD